ncbi:MAG: Xaa-Pro aminopeptidase [Planctomycetota bacterium]
MTGRPRDVFAERRRRFLDALGERGAALVAASPVCTRSSDTLYDYRPNSDLWYLTGFEEPRAAALFLPGHEEHPFVMFVQPRDRSREIWDGWRLGVEAAPERLGCDAAFPIGELAERLPKLLTGRSRLVYGLGWNEDMDRTVIRTLHRIRPLGRKGKPTPRAIEDPIGILHEMRLVKSMAEIAALRRAAQVSAEGHLEGMRKTRPGMREYELQAEIEYVFKTRGALAPAYATIAGSGPNACILHYTENRRRMEEGDLVLVDAGAEVGYYSGDITRTWPVGGTFTGAQRDVYDLVLRAQMAVIRSVKPGLGWQELHQTSVRVLTEGLIDLGVLEGPPEKAIEEKTYRKVYMHGAGHWLGMDVHDVGAYAADGDPGRPLEPGMVFTVEPGLYFHADEDGLPERYRGIGVRIEDDVVVTEDGCDVLSSGVPKEPERIEEIVGARA